eukprot:1161865-Pelagomonas_calceolata.AAC.4
MHFNASHHICGARIKTYLLEKSRWEGSSHHLYPAGALNLQYMRQAFSQNQTKCTQCDEANVPMLGLLQGGAPAQGRALPPDHAQRVP